MDVLCKELISDNKGSAVFIKGRTYATVEATSQSEIVLKDETGCLRVFIDTDKFFKQHFKIEKEKA
jgi:hypothetical protein